MTPETRTLLSGVISHPAQRQDQRLTVNSFTGNDRSSLRRCVPKSSGLRKKVIVPIWFSRMGRRHPSKQLQLSPEGERHSAHQKQERDGMIPSDAFTEIRPCEDDKHA